MSAIPVTVSVGEVRNLTVPQRLFGYWAVKHPEAIALRQKDFGVWQSSTWKTYAHEAGAFGLGLMELGVRPGESIAILSENRKEWTYAQLGAGLIRAVTAGVYPTSPAQEVGYLLELSEAPVIICEDQEQLDKVMEVRASLLALRHIIVIDPKGLRHYDRAGILEFADVIALGRARNEREPSLVQKLLEQQSLDDVGLIVFTSGSTGRPKAAMMTWRGLGRAAEGMNTMLGCGPGDNLVSYLPLCHVAEQMFSIHVPMATGAVVNFAESLRTVQEDLRELAPQVFFGVPRIWEKFHSSIHFKIREAGGLRQKLYARGMASMATFGETPREQWSIPQRLTWAFWYVALLRSLLNFVGLRNCRIAISSGAPISPEILQFFRVLGLPIREAYGLTEASGPTNLQPSGSSPIGSVGIPFPGTEMKLADDGEIMFRGDVVFKGYYRNDAATAEAVDAEGWLRTGDVGCWVEGPVGRELKVIDRKKDIMITAGGKNITPSEIENALRFSPYIKEAIVIADRRRFVSALIQIDYEGVGKWAEETGIGYTNFKSLAEMPQVRALLQAEVDAVNDKMPQVQQVRKFHLLVKELDHDDGEVTATMKVKRSSIARKYHDVIEAIYA